MSQNIVNLGESGNIKPARNKLLIAGLVGLHRCSQGA